MYIVEISPILKSIRNDAYSYFSKDKLELGQIVTIPVRNKSQKGIVLDCKSAAKMKTEIRQGDFALKKVKGVSQKKYFTPEFIESVSECANYFATSTGAVLNSILPTTILEDFNKIESQPTEKNTNKKIKESSKERAGNAKYILQSSDKERYQDYKSIIRSRFAKGGSVLFCVPTKEDAENARIELSKGIESNTILIHSGLSKNDLISNWNQIAKNTGQKLIIVAGNFVGVPTINIKTIIIERESSRAYKMSKRPHLDIRKFLDIYASKIHAEIFLGDLMLRAETLQKYDEHEYFEFSPIKFRFVTTADQKLIDLGEENKPKSGEFSFISKYAWDIIEKNQIQNKKTFILVSRKGLAPNIVCGDCGKMVTCDMCSSPMVLYTANSVAKSKNDDKTARDKHNFFKCRKCGAIRGAGETCKKCNGWRLSTLGTGTEALEKEIQEKLNEKIFIIDKDHTTTNLQARKMAEKFYEAPSGILIGTEMALLYLKEQVDNVIVVSIDAMFSIPDFNIRERILNILMRAKDLARNKFILQTRNPEDWIFHQTIDGNLADFYRGEFVERKKFHYPPFSILIKITNSNLSQSKLEKEFNDLAENIFNDYDFIYYPSFTEKIRGKYYMNAVIKIEPNKWPDKILREKIINLPPQYSITIDADSVL